jgi:hypothetical protein
VGMVRRARFDRQVWLDLTTFPDQDTASFDKLQGSAMDAKCVFMTRNDSRNISSLQ